MSSLIFHIVAIGFFGAIIFLAGCLIGFKAHEVKEDERRQWD